MDAQLSRDCPQSGFSSPGEHSVDHATLFSANDSTSAGPAITASPFRSFWMGGYEGADHRNSSGMPIDIGRLTRHTLDPEDDYARLADFGIRTVRESAGWRLTERDGHFDFSSLEARLDAARRHRIQIVWTLCHFGSPDDVDILDDRWIGRFERYAKSVVRFIADRSGEQPAFTPINEISFLAWAVGETCLIHPHRGGLADHGLALKRRLVRAAIAGSNAIADTVPGATIVTVDPMIHLVAPADRPDLVERAAIERAWQFEAWDLLSGAREPGLGGNARHLGVVGINYYHGNQWELETNERLHWHLDDARRLSLRSLIGEAATRYGAPMIVAETSHVGVGRGAWIREVARDVAKAIADGLPVHGICLYPIVDRPDWERPDHWHNSGLWDLGPAEQGYPRMLCEPYAHDLRNAQRNVRAVLPASDTFHPTATTENDLDLLIVFSHLRWNFVFQRPQHLITRLAQDRQVWFFEEPIHDDGPAFIEISEPHPNVRVLRPHTPVTKPGFDAEQMPLLQSLLAIELQSAPGRRYSAWFYTPMAMPLLERLQPQKVIYDCMDELSAFRGAPAGLIEAERALFSKADLVFTGGPGLYDAKKSQHRSTHCFPSSVDAAHFARGASEANAHPALDGLPRPRLGFFGVIDERLDIPLLAYLAAARPQWQIGLVGPVVKIDPAHLPRAANIHYYGQQSYDDLPRFLAGWDVCLLPFALNESTKFISPTKTLEYMAAGKPVVSTPIADVARLYGEGVRFAATAEGFVDACQSLLEETEEERSIRRDVMQRLVDASSWDDTVDRMRELLDDATSSSVAATTGISQSRSRASADMEAIAK